MDAKPQKSEIEALIARSEVARQSLAVHYHSLRHQIDLPARISENIRSHRTLWFVGAAVAGLFVSSLFRKKAPAPLPVRTSTARKGLLGLALTSAIALAKPAIKTWLLSEVQKRLIPRVRPRQKTSPFRHFSD